MLKLFRFCWLLILFACEANFNNLILKNSHFEEITFSSLDNSELKAFTFLSTECPLSINYTKTLNELKNDFSERNIIFYIVFSGKYIDKNSISAFVKKYELNQNILIDDSYELSDFMNATVTPQCFLLNKQNEIIYSGKIDNWTESLGVKRQVITEFYLKDAIENYLSNKPIKIKKTEPVGCIIE